MLEKLLWDADRVLFWIAAVVAVAWFFGWINGERPAKECGPGRVELRLNLSGIAMYVMMAAALPFMARTFTHRGAGKLSIVSSSAVLIVIFSILADFPGTLIIGAEGLEEKYWLRKNKRIRWNEIVEIQTDRKSRSVTIKSSTGKKIVHSAFLSGRSKLLQELKLHCGGELPADFPREPVENA